MLDGKIYQAVFDELASYLPAGWENLVVYLEYGHGSYSFSFFVKNNGDYKKCYDIESISEKNLMESFKKIDKLISTERNKDKSPWSSMTMTVSSKGKMHTDFDYSDLTEGSFIRKKNWKIQYLV